MLGFIVLDSTGKPVENHYGDVLVFKDRDQAMKEANKTLGPSFTIKRLHFVRLKRVKEIK